MASDPRWVFNCAECRCECTHSEISGEISDYSLPQRPEIKDGGFEFTCPNCGHIGFCKRTDVRYRDESRGGRAAQSS